MRQSLEPLALMTSVSVPLQAGGLPCQDWVRVSGCSGHQAHSERLSLQVFYLPAAETSPRRHLQPLGSAAKRLFSHSLSFPLFFVCSQLFPTKARHVQVVMHRECDEWCPWHTECLCQQAHRAHRAECPTQRTRQHC